MNKQPKKYRSKIRDEPRILYPVGYWHEESKKTPEQLVGTLAYHSGEPKLLDIFDDSILKNKEQISKDFTKIISRVTNSFNFQYELASHYMWLIHAPIGARISDVIEILLPCFQKTLVGLTTALDLTRKGLWGPARPLVRHAFESLIVAKFCSVNNDSEVFDKWVDGVNIYFTNGILKKISVPDPKGFSLFWSQMSEYSHSSVYALQPDFNIQEYRRQISINFVLIEMMLECKYHLLISHIITPDMKYYQSRYKDQERVRELRKLLSSNYSSSKEAMASSERSLIRNYRSKWHVNV